MEDLMYRIQHLRQRMHVTALEKGIPHPDVLRASQMLDEAINEYYNIGMMEEAG